MIAAWIQNNNKIKEKQGDGKSPVLLNEETDHKTYCSLFLYSTCIYSISGIY